FWPPVRPGSRPWTTRKWPSRCAHPPAARSRAACGSIRCAIRPCASLNRPPRQPVRKAISSVPSRCSSAPCASRIATPSCCSAWPSCSSRAATGNRRKITPPAPGNWGRRSAISAGATGAPWLWRAGAAARWSRPPRPASASRSARSNHRNASDRGPCRDDDRLMSESLATLFSADGALAETLPAFRPREGQLGLAETIDRCLDAGQDLVAEAATGTGKTLAYLVPVLLRGERTIISTGTLNLQDQLFRRDLPLALKALGVERKVALLKGRANYLCLHRLERHVSEPALFEDVMGELRTAQRWAGYTNSGEISEIGDIPAASRVWPLVTSTQDNCLGSDCPFLSDCHLVHARRRAQEADIVVVNHHLLFADMALKQTGFGEVLPGAETVVIDEAHQVPDTAMRFFSRGLSAWQVRELTRDTLAASAGAAGSLKLLQAPVAHLRPALEQAVSVRVDMPARG